MGETQASHNWRDNGTFSKPRSFRDEAIDDCIGVCFRDVAENEPNVRSRVFHIWQYISAARYGRLSIPNSQKYHKVDYGIV